MKKKLYKFGYLLLLALHLILVFVVPVIPWIFVLHNPHWWSILIAVGVFGVVQLPIMLYAATKDHSIIDKLFNKIKELE